METATMNENTESRFADLAAKAIVGKMLLEDCAELGMRKAQHLLSRAREAGEDCLDETTYYVKHHPWKSYGIAAGAGALVGLLFGLTCSRARK